MMTNPIFTYKKMGERQRRNVKGDIVLKGPNRVDWNIPEFFSLPKEEYYTFESPYFSYKGGTWCFECSPNIKDFQSIRLFLKREKFPSNFSLDLEMGIHIFGDMEIVSRQRNINFSKDGQLRGLPLFLERSYLQRIMFCLPSPNELRFFCKFNTESKENASSQTEGASNYTEEKSVDLIDDDDDSNIEFTNKIGVKCLVQNLKDLFLREEQSDILVKVKDKEFKTHKAILGARSNVFSSMFAHNTLEKRTNVVEITDCDPDGFMQFLKYLYTGQVEKVPGDQVIDVYRIADKYNVEELKEECVNYMKDHMTVDTFCDVMSLALNHNEKALIENANKYFAENIKKIIVTAKWITFMKENPVESNEIHIKALDYGNKM